jgi:hypothetical protein
MSVRRWQVGVCVVCVLLLQLLVALPAYGEQGESGGDWLDLTLYCGQGVCVPFGVHHRAHARVAFYRVGEQHRVVYWQHFGGAVFPAVSLCGAYDWLLGSTQYVTASGNMAILGWEAQPAWCAPNQTCRSYTSVRSYWLTCENCLGEFESFSWFNNRCWPNSRGHTTRVRF